MGSTPEEVLRDISGKVSSEYGPGSVLKTFELLWNGKGKEAFKTNLLTACVVLLHEALWKEGVLPPLTLRSRISRKDHPSSSSSLFCTPHLPEISLVHDEDEEYFDFLEAEEKGEFLPFLEGENEGEEEEEEGNDFEIGCNLCGDVDENEEAHRKSHVEKGECYICGKRIKGSEGSSYIPTHIQILHCDLGNYPCGSCPKVFALEKDLQSHWNFKHEYECGVCGKKDFKGNHSAYLTHISLHEGIKNFCVLCGWHSHPEDDGYFRLHTDSVHNRAPHENPCPICGKIFRSRRGVSLHVDRWHGTTDFKCNTCSISFFNETEFQRHNLERHGTAEFTCLICKKAFVDRERLLRHSKNIHRGTYSSPSQFLEDGEIGYNCSEDSEKPEDNELSQRDVLTIPNDKLYLDGRGNRTYEIKTEDKSDADEDSVSEPKCYICDRVFDTIPSFKKHIKEHSKNGICHICGKKLASGEDYVRIHIKTVHENKTDYKCETCGKCFGSRRGLELHGIRKHLDEFKCKVCQRDCLNKEKFLEHIKSHEGVDNFCHICGILVSGKSYLKVHIKTVHENNTDHKCQYCGKCFGQRSGLKLHMERWHDSSDAAGGGEESKEETSYCPHCDKTFPKKSYLKVHIRTVHDKKTEHRCDVCGRFFAHRQSLLFHIKRIHEQVKDRTCDTCGKLFGDPEDVRSHINNVHKKVKVFHCDMCEFQFPNAYTLQSHVKIVHMKVKDFQCDTCGRSFGRPADVRAHVKLVHERIKDYMCETCGKYFGREMDLLRHIQSVHEHMKNYQCAICFKHFALKHNLNKHVRVVHEKAKDYKCEVCHKFFGLKGTLQKHIEGVHEGRRDAKCEICGKCFSCISHVKRHTKKVHKDSTEITQTSTTTVIIPTSQQPQALQQDPLTTVQIQTVGQEPQSHQVVHTHLVHHNDRICLQPLVAPSIHSQSAT